MAAEINEGQYQFLKSLGSNARRVFGNRTWNEAVPTLRALWLEFHHGRDIPWDRVEHIVRDAWELHGG